MTIETVAKKLGACPQCGAKLPDVPVSLCPYCASPLETQADREARASVHAARIGRIREHKDFPDAAAWVPPETAGFYRAGRIKWWARLGLFTGGAILGGSLVTAGGHVWQTPGFWLALPMLGAAAYGFRAAQTQLRSAMRFPMLVRPAIILDRRSETEIRGWSGFTTYFFKLEFEDGAQGEFSFPGLGPQEEPYATNLPGVAYSRGTELLSFRHIRV